MSKELLQQALDALGLYLTAGHGNSTDFAKQGVAYNRSIECISAIGEVIAQPVQPATYEQSALELCDVCGWKALIPDDCCLNCIRDKNYQPVQPITDADITRIALANGFKLKEQSDGTLALNPYVFEFARVLLSAQHDNH